MTERWSFIAVPKTHGSYRKTNKLRERFSKTSWVHLISLKVWREMRKETWKIRIHTSLWSISMTLLDTRLVTSSSHSPANHKITGKRMAPILTLTRQSSSMWTSMPESIEVENLGRFISLINATIPPAEFTLLSTVTTSSLTKWQWRSATTPLVRWTTLSWFIQRPNHGTRTRSRIKKTTETVNLCRVSLEWLIEWQAPKK